MTDMVSFAGGDRETLSIETGAGKTITFQIEVAQTPDEQAQGLMFRNSLPANGGMLFTYSAPQHLYMWMKNTYIPLDMLFIAGDGTIRRIARNTEPFSEDTISSGEPVSAVLEIAGGEARRLGIEVGDRVAHPHFR